MDGIAYCNDCGYFLLAAMDSMLKGFFDTMTPDKQTVHVGPDPASLVAFLVQLELELLIFA